MQRVSSLYQAEVQRPFAGQALLRITFGLVDVDAAATCAPVAFSLPQAVWSRPDTIFLEEGERRATYATFEPGRMRLDGSQLILPQEPDQRRAEGLVSAAISGADGLFSAAQGAPVLRLRFSKRHTVPGLTLVFDVSTGDRASRVRLVARGEGKTLLDRVYTPDTAIFRTPDAIERFDEIDLHFLGTVPAQRRLRLQQILFGFGLVFGNAQVQSAAHKMETDPITRRLPVNAFEFSIVNSNAVSGGEDKQYLYDPDNLDGVYRYISEQSPVRVEYGQLLSGGLSWGDAYSNTWGELELNGWQEVYEGGVVEWVPGGRFYLTAQPTVDGLYARFKAQDALSRLDKVYDKGVYAGGGRSLYALAQEVLEDAALQSLDGNNVPWRLWEGLCAVTTTAPLPVKKHKELLQLIAHAGRCVLYTDRTGCVRIEPESTVQDNLKLDFHTLSERPKVTQIPTLRAVQCAAHSYVPEEQSTQVYEKAHLFGADGRLSLHVSFAASAEHTVSAKGARVVSFVSYARAAEVVLEAATGAEALVDEETGARAVKLSINAHKLAQAASSVTAVVAATLQPDANGSVETLENPLITSEENARAVAEWVRDYLLLRNTYEFAYRGSPEVECGDLVWLETQFAPHTAPARVLKSELSFDGSLRGKMTAKRMVNQ